MRAWWRAVLCGRPFALLSGVARRLGGRPRLWAVVFVVWAVVAARRRWVVVGVGRLTAGRCGGCCRVAAVVCRRSVVCWCVRLDWLGWDWDAHQSTTNDDFVVRRLLATSLTATWHLEGALARGTDGDDLLWRVTTLRVVTRNVVTVRRHRVVGVVGRASWRVVVVEEEPCGLLIAPKSSIGICRRLLWA